LIDVFFAWVPIGYLLFGAFSFIHPNNLHRTVFCSYEVGFQFYLMDAHLVNATLFGATNQITSAISRGYTPSFRCCFHTGIAANTFASLKKYPGH